MDVSKVWIERVKRRFGDRANIEFVHCDVRSATLPHGAYDAVLVHWMFHDIDAPDRPAVPRAIADALRPGGRLYIREPTKPTHGISGHEVRRLASAAGFTEVRADEGATAIVGSWFEAVFEKRANTTGPAGAIEA